MDPYQWGGMHVSNLDYVNSIPINLKDINNIYTKT
jgi:hypothetical protein